MLDELSDRLLATWDVSRCGPIPRLLGYLGIAGRVESASLTLLVFGDARPRPLLAVKVWRDADGGPLVRSEADLLSRLAGIPDVARSVPRVVLADRIGGSWVLAQTALRGGPLAGSERDVAPALDWLERLHRAERPAAGGALRARIALAFNELRGSFEIDGGTDDYLRSIDVERAVACGAFIEHGDFTPHNVLRDARGLGVIDWSEAHTSGIALHDALTFLTTAHVLRTRTSGGIAEMTATFARTFLDDGEARESVRAALHRHAIALAVDRGAIDALFGIYLVMTAVAEAGRMRRAHARGSWSLLALRMAADEGLGPERIVEAQPWIRFLRAVAARGGTALS